VDIDIKPGMHPNSINLDCHGVIPVAILTDESFDASTVDPPTVIFAEAQPKHWALEDVDQDGDVDLVLHFKCQELALALEDEVACLDGYTYGGTNIWSCDSVSVVPGKN
jgi:hypothetical protein